MNKKIKDGVNIVMFGCFDILYNGKTIFLETSANVKGIALLRFLLSQRDKVFTAEAIAENVWPENEYVDEKKVIRTYIHRLRKIISQENAFKKDFSPLINVQNIKGGYKIELAEEVYIDMDHFEQYKNMALNSRDQSELLNIFEDLTSIYDGSFLEECRNDPWAIVMRNSFVKSFSEVANHILGILFSTNDYEKMIEVCKKSFVINDLDENINIYYMEALIGMEQISNALQHYTNISNKMLSELSITPSERMKTIYGRIRSFKGPESVLDNYEAAFLDKQVMYNMINEAVKSYFVSQQQKYSVAYLTVMKLNNNGEVDENGEYKYWNEDEKQEIKNNIKYALEYALRRNDMYSITNDGVTLIILNDAKEEYYSSIANRITAAFYSRYTDFKYKIKVKIFPVKII